MTDQCGSPGVRRKLQALALDRIPADHPQVVSFHETVFMPNAAVAARASQPEPDRVMPYTLAFLHDPVPSIPSAGDERRDGARPADRQEHFGTEDAALRRAAELLPGPDWMDLRLYGPDGRRLFDQAALAARLGKAGEAADD
jgi:hypothetical protein